jgi:hypothetical protein
MGAALQANHGVLYCGKTGWVFAGGRSLLDKVCWGLTVCAQSCALQYCNPQLISTLPCCLRALYQCVSQAHPTCS